MIFVGLLILILIMSQPELQIMVPPAGMLRSWSNQEARKWHQIVPMKNNRIIIFDFEMVA